MPAMKSTSVSAFATTDAQRRGVGGPQPWLEIWGQCSKCAAWFDCGTWFDRSVPTPTCPSCALPPGALRYERADVPHGSVERVLTELWLG